MCTSCMHLMDGAKLRLLNFLWRGSPLQWSPAHLLDLWQTLGAESFVQSCTAFFMPWLVWPNISISMESWWLADSLGVQRHPYYSAHLNAGWLGNTRDVAFQTICFDTCLGLCSLSLSCDLRAAFFLLFSKRKYERKHWSLVQGPTF